MTNKDLWKKFKDSGLLWWINTLLHTFGWRIVYKMEKEEIIDVYPERTNCRGFSEKTNAEGYIKVSKYLKENVEQLYEESREE